MRERFALYAYQQLADTKFWSLTSSARISSTKTSHFTPSLFFEKNRKPEDARDFLRRLHIGDDCMKDLVLPSRRTSRARNFDYNQTYFPEGLTSSPHSA
jgi:hypothetical protein